MFAQPEISKKIKNLNTLESLSLLYQNRLFRGINWKIPLLIQAWIVVMYWLIRKSTNRWRVALWLDDDGRKYSLTKFAQTRKCFISTVEGMRLCLRKNTALLSLVFNWKKVFFYKFSISSYIPPTFVSGDNNTVSSIKEYYSSHLTFTTLVLMKFCNFSHKH